jgi:hypothetical protein
MERPNNLLQIASSLGCYTPQAEKLSIAERAQKRVEILEVNRQKNIEDVLQVAQNILQQDPSSTNENQIDRDWFTRVINNAQDVSDDEMKRMWGKVLAGEIKHPKLYSLRTLDVLRNMTKDDAKLIIDIAPYILRDFDDNVFVFNDEKDNGVIEFSKILYLMELGILDSNTTILINESFDGRVEDLSNEVRFWNQNIGLIIKTNSTRLDFPAYDFTSIGKQILTLIDGIKPDTQFYESFLKIYSSNDIYCCGIIREGTFGKHFELESVIFEKSK